MAAPALLLNPISQHPSARAALEFNPRSLLGKVVKDCLAHLPDELARELIDRVKSVVVMESELSVVRMRMVDVRRDGTPIYARDDFGVVSRKLVTNNGVGFIVDAFQNLVELENMKFHGYGTGVTAEAVGDSALVTELTTQYAVDNTRPTGTTTQNGENVYETVATLSPDSGGTLAITEHGVFSQAATGGGVLLDRSLFSAVNLVAGTDSLQTTYRLTLTAGG